MRSTRPACSCSAASPTCTRPSAAPSEEAGMNKTQQLLCLATSGLLVACGGGGSDAGMDAQPAAANEVPASALASPAAYTQFAVGQARGSSETDEPLSADKVLVPPASESSEPDPV